MEFNVVLGRREAGKIAVETRSDRRAKTTKHGHTGALVLPGQPQIVIPGHVNDSYTKSILAMSF